MAELKPAKGVRAYTLRELSRRTKSLSGTGLPLYSEESLREFTRRRDNPLPCIRSGGKRPHVYVFESVLLAFIAFEMGVSPYAEVEQEARRVSAGALS